MDGAAKDRLRAAIGRNSEYYLARWSAMDAAGRTVSWNWAACLLSVYWLIWRKMWLLLALFLLANVAIGFVFGLSPALSRWAHLPMIALTFVTGAWGNHFYRRRVERVLAAAGDDEARLRRLGGTSPLALVVAVMLTLAAGALLVRQAMTQLGADQVAPKQL